MGNDTIAAVATAFSNSGIGIIRVSGKEAISIVNQIFVNKNKKTILDKMESHTIRYGFIIDEKKEIIDEVMVSLMKAPKSFTREDTVEINCHGGILLLNKILQILIYHGARLAEPGEFTKRAFLNGRIDLSEAEAVMDIISSDNELALKNSVRQLRGSVSEKIKELRASILYEIAFIESALDDPEHISLCGYPEKLSKKVDLLIDKIHLLIQTADHGKVIHDGIRTVLLGKPNAGKSSLLNLLSGEEKAIVTDIAGTTRDILEENIRLSGVNLHMIDTAGIHSTDDFIEKIGVSRAKKYADDADLILYVVDSSVPLDENDEEILHMIQNKKCIVLYNKSDLHPSVSYEEVIEKIGGSHVIIKTSTKEKTGFEDFENAVKDLFFQGELQIENEVMITNTRHKEALMDAYRSLQEVQKSLQMQMPEDFYSIDLMNAYTVLGKIIGEEVEDDLVNEIFSKFCTGK